MLNFENQSHCFMTIFRNFKNQSHNFMTIFSNFINQGVTNKLETLRYFRLKSRALARSTTHKKKKPLWTNEKLK